VLETESDRGIHRATPQFSRIRSSDSSSPPAREIDPGLTHSKLFPGNSRRREIIPASERRTKESARERESERERERERERESEREREREREKTGGRKGSARRRGSSRSFPLLPLLPLPVPFSSFFVRRTPRAVIRAIIQLARRI